jgi:hypothetical protein
MSKIEEQQHNSIKGIKTAILIYEDPIHGPRRVLFGEPTALLDLFWVNSNIIYRRIMNLRKIEEGIENPEDMEKAIDDTREWFSKKHGKAAAEDMEMLLSYAIIRNK